MKSGTAFIDRVEGGKVYYNARIGHFFGGEAMFQFPVPIDSKDEKFVFLSQEKIKVFRDEIRTAIELNLVKQVY